MDSEVQTNKTELWLKLATEDENVSAGIFVGVYALSTFISILCLAATLASVRFVSYYTSTDLYTGSYWSWLYLSQP